ncbi:MAG: hypothetical protein JWO06_986 [Bacteroidota bacterium]|nr:hypothetical protein [Bacteroidota bacterium]
MKTLTLIASAILLNLAQANAQNLAPRATYTPFHQALQQGTNNHANGAGRSGMNNEKITTRHDVWDGRASAWVYTDSSELAYNAQMQQTGNTSFQCAAMAWSDLDKTSNTYDAAGHILNTQKQTWANGTWQNVSNYTASFNSNNSPLINTYQVWSGANNAWLNTFNFVFTYDAAKNLTQEVDQVWNASTGTWTNLQKNIWVYDVSRNCLSNLSQRWDASTANWENNTKINSLYDISGNKTSQVEQLWASQVWVNYFQYIYSYDLNHNNTLQVSQSWNTNSGTWTNHNKQTFAFDNNNNRTLFASSNWDNTAAWAPDFSDQYMYNVANLKTGEVEQNWNTSLGAYENSFKNVYSYDANNNNISYEDFYWNDLSSAWVNNTNFTNTFDTNNNNIYELAQAYNTDANAFANTGQYFFYYSESATTGIEQTSNALRANIYPNPTNGSDLHINLDLSANAELQMNTYDQQGRMIASQTQGAAGGTSDLSLSYTGLSNGTYFVQVTDRNTGKQSTLKFVKD